MHVYSSVRRKKHVVWDLAFSGRVTQNTLDVLVGWVLSQSTHDISDLVEGNLVVANSVKETEGLFEIWRKEIKYGLYLI